MYNVETKEILLNGRSRRKFVGKIGAVLAGALLPLGRIFAAKKGGVLIQAPDGAAPTEAGYSFPPDDVRRYGIAPNVAAAASTNTTKLKALVNPAGAFTGRLVFPNTTGSDVYYFDDLIAFHDGIHLDLMNSTLSFAKTGVAHDSASGFIHAIRDFTIENGNITTSYVFKGGYNTGNALAFGGRGADTALFPNLYDSLLSAPMGGITIRNLHIRGSATGGSARGIFMLGGFDGVVIDNVSIDGQKQLSEGIYYEFGWATNEPKEIERHSSHARNFRGTNLSVTNVINAAFGASGAYDIVIDGLRVSDVGHGCLIGTGEALYFRAWLPSGDRARRPSFVLRNFVGELIQNAGVAVVGASKISGSYLDNPPAHDNPLRLGADQQSDLIDFVLDRFSLSGAAKNYGIVTSAAEAQIRNGTLSGFARGIVTTQECTKFVIDSVKIFDSANFGIQIGQGVTIHTPPRLATGLIANCVIAGSGAAGKAPGLYVGTTRSCVIEGNRFGYSMDMDGKAETTQTQAVSVAADASGVVCRNNYVAATADGAVAYVLAAGGGGGRECRIENPRGIQTASGAWLARR
ncbi:MAG TPA: right-handed parallel beta-helix repeat-containing protein [Steroidobacteraceae bacterium]|jgi:hypothetical protein|nr:right-handed parallel beta-helix repeat-containing protein [Steroidobacteraceae bacterium]